MELVDSGAIETDELLKKLEERIREEYETAEAELRDKLEEYLKEYDKQNKKKLKQVEDGILSQEDYNKWKKEMALKKKWLEEMVDTISSDAVMIDEKVMSIVNGYTPEAYAINHNFAAFEIEQTAHIEGTYSLYSRETVERLLREDPELLPSFAPDPGVDLAWHKRKFNTAIVQGILQGEPAKTVSRRLQDVVGMDKRAAIRNARTAVTSAQNAGRIDVYHEAQSLGIEVMKEWRATYDTRTRHSHRILNEEIVKADEEFSNGCKFPGDPDGAPSEVYNCRCTLLPYLPGYPPAKIEYNGQRLNGMTFNEWKQENAPKKQEERKAVEPNAIKLPAEVFKPKQAKALEDFLTGVKGKDPEVAELFGTIGGKVEGKDYPIKVSYTAKNHQVSATHRISTGEIVECKVSIPKMDGDALSQSVTTVHEVGHFIDLLYGDNRYYTSNNAQLLSAINSGNKMSEKTKVLFEGLKKEGDRRYDEIMDAVIDKNDVYNSAISDAFKKGEYTTARKLMKERDSAWRSGTDRALSEMRAAQKGYDGLEDIYDAITGGKLQADGYFGHGAKYYSDDTNKVVETFANFCSMSQTNPDALEILRVEQPGIYEACRSIVRQMLGKE